MKHWVVVAGLVGFALLLPGAKPARTDGNSHSRVSAVEGNLLVRGGGDEEWSYLERNGVVDDGDSLWADEESLAEIEMEGGAWLRLGPDTRVEVRRLPPDGDLRLERGSLYVDLSREIREGLRVRTAPGEVVVEAGGLARVDLGQGDAGRILVRRGQLMVRPAEGGDRRLEEGEMALLRPDEPQVDVSRLNPADRDDFDRWNEQRVAYYAGRSLPAGVERRLPGVVELADYGDWVTVEGDRYWQPQRVAEDWGPYTVGYWSYWRSGPVWMPYEPGGYTTSHYGRWRWHVSYGWLWRPDYVWGAAWVAWAYYGDYVLWAPLDWWGSPCIRGVPYYAGELRVDPFVWSMMLRGDFHRRDRHRIGRLDRHREFDFRRIHALPEPHRLTAELSRGGRIRGRLTTETAHGSAVERLRALEKLPRRSEFRIRNPIRTPRPGGGVGGVTPEGAERRPPVRRNPAVITPPHPPPAPSGTRRKPGTGSTGRTPRSGTGGPRTPGVGGNRGRGTGAGPGRTRGGGGARGVPTVIGGGHSRPPTIGGGRRRLPRTGGGRDRQRGTGGNSRRRSGTEHWRTSVTGSSRGSTGVGGDRGRRRGTGGGGSRSRGQRGRHRGEE